MLDNQSSVRPHAVSRALLAGFISSTVMMYTFALAFWASEQSLRLLGPGQDQLAGWIRNLTYNYLVNTVHATLAMSVIFHLLLGMAWAVVYALAVEPRLGGQAWKKGMTFSLVPWLLSVVVFFPLIGAGIFGMHLGAGPLPVGGNLILHLCYGLILGVSYGPLADAVMAPDATAADRRQEIRAMSGSTVRSAQGLMVGLLLGALAGTSLSHSSTSAYAPGFVLMAGIVLGGALGCLVGAFVGLPVGLPQRGAVRDKR